MEKKYDISCRKTSICKAGERVLELFPLLADGEYLKQKLVIGEEKRNGKYPVYIDEVSNENLVGLLFAVKNSEGEDVEDTELSRLTKDGGYEVRLYRAEDKIMTGQIVVSVPDGSVVETEKGEYSTEILSLMNEKVRKGIVTEQDAAERLKVLYENGCDEMLVKRVISGYRTRTKSVKYPSTIYVDPYLEESKKGKREGIVAEGLRAAVSRHGIICEGEKSVGKNVYVETIAWLLGMPSYLITFSRSMSPSAVYGEKSTDNSAAEALASFDTTWLKKERLLKNPGLSSAFSKSDVEEIEEHVASFEALKAQAASVHIKIDASELYDWMTDGGLMVFNEVNLAEANFLASFTNQLLDGTGFLFIPGRGEVPISEDCVLFATQNADYCGVEEQNEATMSRFGCIVFRQPDSIRPQLERAVTAALKKDGMDSIIPDPVLFEQAERFYVQVRESSREGSVSNAALNIRGFVRAITEVAESSGHAKLARQIEIHVINTCPTDEREVLKPLLKALVKV